MTGYKRVSFYELCRLCASNTQKEKTHIFQEEGRKIQLQNKIQACLAVTVNENDFLPKVVCSKCLRTLETCFGFRQECVRSESMLSTYFKNFRYTEDFKKSGKVYIKDIKPPPPPVVQQNPEISTSSNISSVTSIGATANLSQNIISINKNQQAIEQVPFYTLQFPTIVSNGNSTNKNQKELVDSTKTAQLPQNQLSYNLNLINPSTMKASLPKSEILSNVVVNSNGEVINIAHLGDFETILSQGSILKNKYKSSKRSKDILVSDDNVVKIDLTGADVSPVYDLDSNDEKYDKLPHIKNAQSQNKYSYLKVDDKNQNQTVIFPLSEYNQNFNNFNTSNAVYTQPNLNVVTNSITSNANVICNTHQAAIDNTALNLNVLNQNSAETNQNGYTNVISSISSNVLSTTTITDSDKVSVQTPDNNNTPNSSNSQQQKIHVCETCLKSFKRREHLGQHLKLHTGFRPYICEQCNKAFMRKEHLIRHSTLHSGQKNYTCNICEKSFSRNDNLLKHKKTHEKQASYTCEICQKQFVMKHYYNAHKLTHGDKCFVSTVWGMLKT